MQNGAMHNGTVHGGTIHNGTVHNGTMHNDTLNNDKKTTQHNNKNVSLSITIRNTINITLRKEHSA
jgi:hypothetical protein